MGARLLLLFLGFSVAWPCLQGELDRGASLTVLFGFTALKCYQCHQVSASGVCESGRRVYQTRGNQQCFVRKIYEGKKLLYGLQGCEDLCIPMSFFRPSVRVHFECCKDRPFCNKF
ncbi:protein PIP-1-like [Erinaceus europaeus]|uniref:Protein PIP-1-like n=1 Tax=Erinaceus europaeus TaxID=9365 RepID=A0ABM3WGX9_ERIEU|nr:protein PIP-1-like [Erinaceus europaeus]